MSSAILQQLILITFVLSGVMNDFVGLASFSTVFQSYQDNKRVLMNA